MAFTQLGNGNFLQMCGKVYGIAKSTTSIIVREFYSKTFETIGDP